MDPQGPDESIPRVFSVPTAHPQSLGFKGFFSEEVKETSRLELENVAALRNYYNFGAKSCKSVRWICGICVLNMGAPAYGSSSDTDTDTDTAEVN